MKKYKTPNGQVVDESVLRQKYGDRFDSLVKDGTFSEHNGSDVAVSDKSNNSNQYVTPNGKIVSGDVLSQKYGDDFKTLVGNGTFKKKVGSNGTSTPAGVNTTSSNGVPTTSQSQNGNVPNPFDITSTLPQKLDNTQPTQQPTSTEVSPTDFLEHEFGGSNNEFAPHTIYNNASNFIIKDLQNHPEILKNAPYPEKFKEQIIKGDGNINIQKYTSQRLGEIEQQQKDLSDKIGGEASKFTGVDNQKISDYKNQIEALEKQKESFKANASEVNDVQAVTQTPLPTDPKKQTDYFREIGRNVNRLNDPIGIENQEKNLKDGTNGARDKELVDTENFTNEQAGIEAKKKQLAVYLGNGQISKDYYDNQMGLVKQQESKLLTNNPGVKSVFDRSTLSKIIDDKRNSKKSTGLKQFGSVGAETPTNNLFNDIISSTPSEDEVKDAIKTAREQGSSISSDEEQKYIADREQIPGTAALGNLYQSSIGSLSTSINNFNPFLSKQEIEGEKYREEKVFQPTQRQTSGVLGYVNQTANVVGTVLKWATLGKFLGAGADAALGSTVGAETAGDISESLGGIRKLSQAQQHLAGTALTAGLLIYPEAKEEAKKFTNDETKQDYYAGTVTLLNTIAFTSLDPEGIIKKIIGGGEESGFSKGLLKAINKAGGLEKLEPETFKETIINAGKKVLGANASATATMTLLNAAQQATDVMYGKKPNFDMNEVKKDLVNNFISFAPLSLAQGAVGAIGDRNKRNTLIQTINIASKDPLAFKDYMDKAVEQGQISQQDANRKIQIVNTHASLKAATDLPAHISEENKAAYADNLRRELEIKQSMQGVEDEVLLKSKEDEIKALQEERKKILNPEHEGGDLKLQPKADDVNYWLRASDSEHDNTKDKIEFLSSILAGGGDEKSQSAKLGEESKPALEKAIEVLKGEHESDLIKEYRDKNKITEKDISDDDLLKSIAQQAQNLGTNPETGKVEVQSINNPNAYENTVSQAGEDLVKVATDKYPKESLLKPEEKEVIPKRNDDFVDKYFKEGTPEREQFDELDEEGQAKMIDDKRKELSKPKGEPENITKPIELSVNEKKEWDSLPLSEKLKLAKENLPQFNDRSDTELAKIADTRAKELLDKLHGISSLNINENEKAKEAAGKGGQNVEKTPTGTGKENDGTVPVVSNVENKGVGDNNLVNESNTKVGDVVYHNGQPVKIVEFRDSRKGGREAVIELPKLTKEEIHNRAIDILRNRYKEFDSSDEDLKRAHIGDYSNIISDLSNSDENSSSTTNVNFNELSKSNEPITNKETKPQSTVVGDNKTIEEKQNHLDELKAAYDRSIERGESPKDEDMVRTKDEIDRLKKELPPIPPKEEKPELGSEEPKNVTNIRKANQIEIQKVADAYKNRKTKKWVDTFSNGLKKISDSNPGKTLYESAVSTLNQLMNNHYGDLTRDEAAGVLLYLKHEASKKRSDLKDQLNSPEQQVRMAALVEEEPIKDIYENASLKASEITSEAGTTLSFTRSDLFDAENGLQLRRNDLIRASGGEKLSPEDEKWLSEKWEQEKKLMEQSQAAREGSMQENFDKEIEKIRKEYADKFKSQKTTVTDKTTREKTLKQKGDEWADRILRAKIKTNPNILQSNILGLLPAAYNALLDGIAATVRGGATIAEAIKSVLQDERFKGVNEDDLTNHLVEIANKQTTGEALQKIKDYVKDSGETDVTKEMVGKNLIKDFVDSHIGEVDQKDILDKAAKDLKKVLPDVDKKKLIEAYLKEGDYKQDTKKDLEGGIKEQKKQLESIAKLEEDIADLKGYSETRQRNFSTEREKSDYEQKLADEKSAIIKDNKDRRNKILEDNRKVEAERNRQLKVVSDLKDKKSKLEQGIIEKKDKLERSTDTPEIEGLRKDVKDLEKGIREAEAAQKAAERKIERDRNSGINRDNKMVEAERNRQMQKVQDLTDKKEKLEKGIRDKKEKIPAKPDTPEIEDLKNRVSDVDKQLREGESMAKEIDRKAQANKDKKAELDANIKRAEAGQDIIKAFKNKSDKEVDEEIESKTRQLKRAINDNTPEDKVQEKLLQQAKETAIRRKKEFKRRLDNEEFEEPELKTLNKHDAELIRLNKEASKVEGEFRAKQDELRQKNKGSVELVAELGRSVYVAFLLHRFLTLGKVAAASIVRPIVEGGTRMTFGKVFDQIWPGISSSAKMGGEGSSWQINKLGYEAWFKQRGQRAIENKAVKVEQQYQLANKKYDDYKNSDNINEDKLKKLKTDRDLRYKATFGNLAYQFIGGSSIKDGLQAFVHRSNEIERQFGKVHSEGIQGKNMLTQDDDVPTILRKIKNQVIEGGRDLFGNYKDDESLSKQVAIKVINDADYILGFIGRSHSAVKTFSGRYSFASGFMARIEGAVERNIQLTSDKVLEYAHESYLDWERGKYQNPNQLSDGFSKWINKAEESFGEGTGKVVKAALKTEVAIQRVPVNILWEEFSQYAGGLFKVAGLVPRMFGDKASIPKLYKGINEDLVKEGLFTDTPEFKEALNERLSNIDPKQAALIYSCFRKGSLGMGIYATALILGGIHYGIFPHMGQKKKKDESQLAPDELNPGQLMVGDTKYSENMSALISHTQFMWPTFMGLGMAQAYHDNVKSGQTTAQAMTKAVYLHLNIIAGSVPQFALVENMKERTIDPFVNREIKSTLGAKHQGFDKKDAKDPTFKYYFDKGVEFTPFDPEKVEIPKKGKLSELPQEKWQEYNTEKKRVLKEELDNLKDNTFYVTKAGKVYMEEPDEDNVGDYSEKTLGQLTVGQLKKVIVPAETKATEAAKEKLGDE